MALEVLLRRTIDGVGEVGEVVKVKNGFARNYLVPQGYAALVSAESLRRVRKDKALETVRQARLAEERAGIAERLKDMTLTVEARAGEDGHLYGSVGMRQVIAAFSGQGFKFIERQIRFETVRELGSYECTVLLSADTQVPIKVWVVQDAAEARAMADDAAREAAAPSEPEAAPDADFGDPLDADDE